MGWVRRISGSVIGVVLAGVVMGAAEQAVPQKTETATFAGGCFWCMEPPFDGLAGVISVTAGYSGGQVPHPTYEQVSSGKTGHAESVQIVFDPVRITYKQLLKIFWRNIDPTAKQQQFADHGSQYRTAVFYHTEKQRTLAEASKLRVALSGKFHAPIATEITRFTAFYPAEEYHQDYAKKSPWRYQLYRMGSGREEYLKKTWGDQAGAHAPDTSGD